MAIDWDRVVVESDDNGVVISAGQVALLIGADADTVTWGNITGDITQQPDLMQIVDGFVSADSPQFTGTPRTPTPPAGNSSTRIASTAFVQGEIGTVVREAPNSGSIYGRQNKDWTALGSLAAKNQADYNTDITNKPTIGEMASASDAPSDNTCYGRENGDWERLGDMAKVSEPPMDSGEEHDYYARTHWYYPNTQEWKSEWKVLGGMAGMDDVPDNEQQFVREQGQWVPVDEPDYNVQTEKTVKWARTNQYGTGPKWEEIDEPPVNTSATKKYYARTSYTENSKRKYSWIQLGGMALESGGLTTIYVDPVNGTDNNDGTTAAKAIKSIEHALEIAHPYKHVGIYLVAGSYLESYLGITRRDITFYCTTEGGQVYISSSASRTDDICLYINSSRVEFACRVKIEISKGIGVEVDRGSTFIVGGLTVSTTGTCIHATNCSHVNISTLYAINTSKLVADADWGSTMNITYVDGDYGNTVTKVFNADGAIITYGSIGSSGASALNYNTLSTCSNGGRVFTGSGS